MTLSQTQTKMTWPPGLVVPTNSRQVKQLLDGTDLRAVSDLIPTAAITESFPLSGQTFSSFSFTNQLDGDPFANYILYNITEHFHNPDFTRLWFCENRANELTVPVQTRKYLDKQRWPKVLHGVEVVGDKYFIRTDVHSMAEGAGFVRPRYAVAEITPEFFEGSLFIDDIFVSVQEPNTAVGAAPTPTPVNFELKGIRGTVDDCLHDGLFIGKEYFPVTRPKRNLPFILKDEPVLKDGLWFRTRTRVVPTRRPKRIKIFVS